MNDLRPRLALYQYIAGISESVAGMFLVGFPVVTFRFMGLNVIPPLAFIRYIGVFVLAVGLTYMWTAIRWPLNEYAIPVWITQWKITALIHSLVALLIFWQLMARGLEARWLVVAIFEGVFAAVQLIGLDQGWIERAV